MANHMKIISELTKQLTSKLAKPPRTVVTYGDNMWPRTLINNASLTSSGGDFGFCTVKVRYGNRIR